MASKVSWEITIDRGSETLLYSTQNQSSSLTNYSFPKASKIEFYPETLETRKSQKSKIKNVKCRWKVDFRQLFSSTYVEFLIPF